MSVHEGTPLRLTLLSLAAAAIAALTACSSGDVPRVDPTALLDDGWPAVLAEAEGTTVRWWLYGGDDRINAYLDDVVAPAAAALGITLDRVPIDDTADAVQRVLAEVEAETTGSIDLIWINGENFANGVDADLWAPGWSERLPNAALVDPATVATDFGVPVEGRESPWSRALFVYAHDPARTPEPPRSTAEVLAYARANPGRITYPAVPDFTGSAFVRQAVTELGEVAAFELLEELHPLLWRGGQVQPASEAELNDLFGNGEVDLAMSYDPSFVLSAVRRGQFAESVRPFTFDTTLNNVSYVAMPVTAPNPAGAMVVADLLLAPELQAAKADPAVLGVPTVLDLDRVDAGDRAKFATTADSPWLLTDVGPLVAELAAERVEAIEQRWLAEIGGLA